MQLVARVSMSACEPGRPTANRRHHTTIGLLDFEGSSRLAGGEERATGYRLSRRYSLRDPFMGLPAVSGAPMDAQNVTSPSAIRYIAIYA
jgi:hypothetical protein